VNLSKFRKKKAKVEKEKKADLNRRLHGRTKAERAADEWNAEKERKRDEGAKLVRIPMEPDDEPND
jgi:hypothetical protein